ncbi:MAG TPA: ABC transporter substrate-binding protein [Paracoccaceae bacterium]|nr:ABC transporter substrate-binding protein [Paracoccaceae bacterium]
MAAALVSGLAAGAQAGPLPLKICHIDDRSGSAADTGIESLNGLNMVIEPLNAAGGINGRKIELITYDGKTDPQLTATFATRCAEDDQGLLIIGGSPSATAQAMVPVANQYRIPYYILSAASVDMKGAAYHFRFGPDVTQDAISVADSLGELGFKKVAIINNSVPFGINGAASVTAALKEKGIEVATQETYDIAATDVSPQVINLLQADPEAVLIYPYPADGARVVRTIRQLGLDVPLVMPRVGMMKAFRELASDAGNGVLVPSSVDMTRPEVEKFFEDYGEMYGSVVPSPSPAQGYDAGVLAAKVLSDPEVQKAIEGGDLEAAREAIRLATERHGQFVGMQGQAGVAYQFAEGQHHGPPDRKFFVFMQVAEDGAALVTPDPEAIKPKN